jgi:RHS repeat-associated protein
MPSAVVNTMLYNADGQRVQKLDSSGTSNFIWDYQNILQETNASNVTQALYTLNPHGYGNQISQSRSAASSFYHFDALGSTAGLSNLSQTLTDTYLYKAFGELLANSGSSTNPFRWVGRPGYYFDADPSQYFVRARYYNPAIARWLSQDPLGSIIDSNLNRYAHNSPSSFLDASGLGTVPAVCVIEQRLQDLNGNEYCRFVCTCPLDSFEPLGFQGTYNRPCDEPPAPNCVQGRICERVWEVTVQLFGFLVKVITVVAVTAAIAVAIALAGLGLAFAAIILSVIEVPGNQTPTIT